MVSYLYCSQSYEQYWNLQIKSHEIGVQTMRDFFPCCLPLKSGSPESDKSIDFAKGGTT